jgi:SAM-dependent methyltransferase
MTSQPESHESIPVRLRLREWFVQTPGPLIVAAEQHLLRQILPDLFGYHIVQLGRLGSRSYLEGSRISHAITVDVERDLAGGRRRDLIALAGALPFAADSVDVVVAPHVLEFECDPHQVLREIERVLIAEGHAILVGFNPWSLFGLWRLMLAWRDDPPWNGRFIGAARMRDWLHLLGFDIVSCKCLYFRPPIRSARANQRLAFLEKLGAHLWSFFGGVYVVVAKKRLLTLTPVRMQWRARRRLIAGSLAEPSTRSQARG